ncbi:MAG: hypothetical protein JW827_01185 [Spirochaetes bacterium]|nr:hypothetical protein [Spirochaetota bacterium]
MFIRIMKFSCIIMIFFIVTSFDAQAKIRLAILDLKPVNLEPQTAVTISDLLRTEVFNTKYFIVPERSEMMTVLKEHELMASGMMDTKKALNTGKMLSAEKVLIGTVSRLGESFIINVRVVDVELGIIDFALKQIVEKEELMAAGCEMMAANLVSKIKDNIIGETVAKEPRPWEAFLELGAGTLFSAAFSYRHVGISAGFDIGREEVENKDYNSYLLHVSLFYHLMLESFLTKNIPGIPDRAFIALRPKIGLDLVMLDKYYTTAYEISPQVLLGYYDFYAILSPSYLICADENTLLFQLGVGYRIRF